MIECLSPITSPVNRLFGDRGVNVLTVSPLNSSCRDLHTRRIPKGKSGLIEALPTAIRTIPDYDFINGIPLTQVDLPILVGITPLGMEKVAIIPSSI